MHGYSLVTLSLQFSWLYDYDLQTLEGSQFNFNLLLVLVGSQALVMPIAIGLHGSQTRLRHKFSSKRDCILVNHWIAIMSECTGYNKI